MTFIVYIKQLTISIVCRIIKVISIDSNIEVIVLSNIAKIVGQRIRNYRTQQGLSQEKLAELAGCHPTYIGQLERGEKNATLESIERIAGSLKISLSELFENIGGENTNRRNIAYECYEFLLAKSPKEQQQIFNILIEMDKYKEN